MSSGSSRFSAKMLLTIEPLMPCDESRFQGGMQLAFIHIDTQLGICSAVSVIGHPCLPGLERTSSTIYQTRGPAWREAIVSNFKGHA